MMTSLVTILIGRLTVTWFIYAHKYTFVFISCLRVFAHYLVFSFYYQRLPACEKGNQMNVRTHINVYFAHYLAFSFYYIYSNVWIFKNKQANIIQYYTSIHTIVKVCNDNCSKPRQHRTSIERPDLVSIWSKRPWT